ncbi:MAG: nitrate ABC transporter ATP-binding protein [Gammaproteobacteria bacterium]|nr:MAG: nitrate ABC transporter ATP-binding protein [Gammaproteobacteria bacterium]
MELRVEKVGHKYGRLTVLQDINLTVKPGEIICIVGPSGCGKSTLLRILGGLEQPTNGRIVEVGRPPQNCLNPLTYVFQHFALLPWRTVAGNIRLVLEDHSLSKETVEEIIDDVLKRTNLSDFREAFPKQLSGGMKQRVAIARALAVNPAVLLMDEPLSSLDSQTTELLMDDLIRLWTHSPFTAVYVTHNLYEAVRLGHQIVVLSRQPGKIREIVTIDTPLPERHSAIAELEKHQQQIWSLLREEAVAADRELHG